MAKVDGNIITKGLSGQLGDQLVFRQLYGETVVSTKGSPTGEPSVAQEVYDDFNTKKINECKNCIDTSKWAGQERGNYVGEVERKIKGIGST